MQFFLTKIITNSDDKNLNQNCLVSKSVLFTLRLLNKFKLFIQCNSHHLQKQFDCVLLARSANDKNLIINE